jgi:endo-1,4-beta-xylanase
MDVRRARRRRALLPALLITAVVVFALTRGAGANLCPRATSNVALDPASRAFASAIPLGAAVRWDRIQDSPGYERFFISHYDWLTPENELKMDSLEPAPGSFDFERADAMVGWALKHGKHVHGHVLVWGTQLPHWVAKLAQRTPTKAGMAKMVKALGTYIVTVIGHFDGRVHEWDVVNEAFNSGGSYVRNAWYRELGPAYVEDAFRAARLADPSAKLCYNDLGTELPGPHSAAVLALVKRLRSLKLLDCVGFELHTSVPGPDPQVLARQLKAFAATGAEALISELDVAARPGEANAQASVYANVARACRATPGCARITTWGFTDASSWLGQAAQPLPFDSQCRAKPAWAALRTGLNATARK